MAVLMASRNGYSDGCRKMAILMAVSETLKRAMSTRRSDLSTCQCACVTNNICRLFRNSSPNWYTHHVHMQRCLCARMSVIALHPQKIPRDAIPTLNIIPGLLIQPGFWEDTTTQTPANRKSPVVPATKTFITETFSWYCSSWKTSLGERKF
eukprot:scaffold5273_cov99-Cylindrotheca_fusiformis.AAC.2